MVDQFLAFFPDELMEITAYVMMVMNIKAWDVSKMEAPIIKDGGFKYGGLKLSIIWPPTLHFFFLVR